MKILLVHNRYLSRGGEDSVFQDEKQLLEHNGHTVVTYLRDNEETQHYSILRKLLFPFSLIFNIKTYRDIKRIIKQQQPDIIHVHNFFPLISPSVFIAAKRNKTPIVMTLHNFRILGNALLMRNGVINEQAITNPWSEVRHKTYRNSYILTFLLILMIYIHKKTFRKTRFIALTPFNKQRFVQGGIPEHNISVKPNFVSVPPLKKTTKTQQAVFVGRLSEEKGIATLAKAWKDIPYTLHVFGDGPLKHLLEDNKNIVLHGYQDKKTIFDEMAKSQYLVFSSQWYECFPITILEAFATKTPVLASNIGNMKTLIQHNITGRHFQMGNPKDLKQQALWMFDHPKQCTQFGNNAYKVYKDNYTPQRNYRQLMAIYEQAIHEIVNINKKRKYNNKIMGNDEK